MKEFTVLVKNKAGLHARPAADFMKFAKKYQCKIVISKSDRHANAKSMLDILTLGICCGETIKINFEGNDEDRAYEAICAYPF